MFADSGTNGLTELCRRAGDALYELVSIKWEHSSRLSSLARTLYLLETKIHHNASQGSCTPYITCTRNCW